MANRRELDKQDKQRAYEDIADRIYYNVRRIVQRNPDSNLDRVLITKNGDQVSLAQVEAIIYGHNGIIGEAFIVDESQNDITVCFIPGYYFRKSFEIDIPPIAECLPKGKDPAYLKVHHLMVQSNIHDRNSNRIKPSPSKQKKPEKDEENF